MPWRRRRSRFPSLPGGEDEGKIYALAPSPGAYPDETAVPNVYLFDPNLDEWDVGDTIPASRRRGSAGVVARDGARSWSSGQESKMVIALVGSLGLTSPIPRRDSERQRLPRTRRARAIISRGNRQSPADFSQVGTTLLCRSVREHSSGHRRL